MLKEKTLEAETLEWCERANRALAALSRARRAQDEAAMAQAQVAVEQIRSGAGAPQKLILRTMLTMTAKEALYYAAMGAHERAERLEIRLNVDKNSSTIEKRRECWRDAIDGWDRYLAFSVGTAERKQHPRDEHAKRLRDRAQKALAP
jgi:DNA-binding TFAR19-related protein (PDSD5 family)